MTTTDGAIWNAERRLWLEGGAAYPELVDLEAVLALPGIGMMTGLQAIEAMEGNEGWKSVEMTEQALCRDGRSVIVIGYRGTGRRSDGSGYEAWCTSTYRAAGDNWRLIQHQQTPTSGRAAN